MNSCTFKEMICSQNTNNTSHLHGPFKYWNDFNLNFFLIEAQKKTLWDNDNTQFHQQGNWDRTANR